MIPSPPSTPALLVPFAIVAAGMVGANLYLLTRAFPRAGGPPHFGTVVLVVGLLSMSAILWVAVIDAIVDPGDASTVAVFIAGNSMMGVFGAWIIAVFYRAEERRLPPKGWLWPAVFAVLVVGSELLMGMAYVLAFRGVGSFAGAPAGAERLVAESVGSVWFTGAMVANMALLLVWLPLPRVERQALGGLAGSAALAPAVIAGSVEALLGMAAVMTVVLVLGASELSRTSATPGPVRTLALVAAAFGTMMAAGAAGALTGGAGASAFPFAVATGGVMTVEIGYLGHWALGRTTPAPERASPEGAASQSSVAGS